MKLKIKLLLILIIVNILLLKNSISQHHKITARLKQANLASKNNIAIFVKKTDNNLKDVTPNKIELNELSKKT